MTTTTPTPVPPQAVHPDQPQPTQTQVLADPVAGTFVAIVRPEQGNCC